jgi:hypothetical protein
LRRTGRRETDNGSGRSGNSRFDADIGLREDMRGMGRIERRCEE